MKGSLSSNLDSGLSFREVKGKTAFDTFRAQYSAIVVNSVSFAVK